MTRTFNEQRIGSLVIQRDPDPSSPREWDNLGRMVCWHDRAHLGDDKISRHSEEAYQSWVRKHAPEGSVALKLYLYEHSGMTMRTTPFGDPWDSGWVGIIAASPEKIREAFMVKRITKKTREKVEECLRSEVKVYDQLLQGQCWGYVITDDDGEEESCWGFFGSELEETGIKDHLPDAAIPLLEEAWEKRYEEVR